MLNGQQVLGSIDQAVETGIAQARAVDQEVAALTERLVQLRQAQTEAYQALARVRLRDLSGDGLIGDLSAAERQARELLSRRGKGLETIEAQLAGIETELSGLATRRTALVTEVETATAALEHAERQALDALAQTEAFRAQNEAVEKAEAVARHAEQKTRHAEEDRATKGKPYEDDALFLYLWERGWGTPRYQGGGITRWLDGKVARLIDYEKARINYATLLEIPQRLADHAKRQRAIADGEDERLEALRTEALKGAEMTAETQTVTAAQARLDALDEEIEAARQRREALTTGRAQLTSGDDAETRGALDVIVTALGRRDLQDLRRQAERTPTPEDDTIVDRIEQIEEDLKEAKVSLDERKQVQAQLRQRMDEIERMRRDYRQQGYGRDAFDFGNAGMLSVLLGQVLGGALSRDVAWDQMNRRRMPRLPGGFGTGGSGGWAGGVRRQPRAPRGIGGGGFRTGGGF